MEHRQQRAARHTRQAAAAPTAVVSDMLSSVRNDWQAPAMHRASAQTRADSFLLLSASDRVFEVESPPRGGTVREAHDNTNNRAVGADLGYLRIERIDDEKTVLRSLPTHVANTWP